MSFSTSTFMSPRTAMRLRSAFNVLIHVPARVPECAACGRSHTPMRVLYSLVSCVLSALCVRRVSAVVSLRPLPGVNDPLETGTLLEIDRTVFVCGLLPRVHPTPNHLHPHSCCDRTDPPFPPVSTGHAIVWRRAPQTCVLSCTVRILMSYVCSAAGQTQIDPGRVRVRGAVVV